MTKVFVPPIGYKIERGFGIGKILFVLIIFSVITFAALYAQHRFPPGQATTIDWLECLRPGTMLLLSGRNPHHLVGCNYMTWSLIPLIPLVPFPPEISRAMLASIAIMVFAFSAHRLGASWYMAVALTILTPYLVHHLLNPNIDWLVALGFTLPPQIGLFFVLVKPQIGFGIAIYWLIQSYSKGGWKQVIKTFAPVTICITLSFLLFGFYLRGTRESLSSVSWNWSLWPYAIPIGLLLLIYAIITRNKGLSIVSSPFLAPYVGYYSWPVALLGLPKIWKIFAILVMSTLTIIGTLYLLNQMNF